VEQHVETIAAAPAMGAPRQTIWYGLHGFQEPARQIVAQVRAAGRRVMSTYR
jgi:hypothetical protein